MTRMARMSRAVTGLGLLLAGLALAQIPTDEYPVDYRVKTPQFALATKQGSSPAFTFLTTVGTTTWTGNGWTLVLHWSQSWDSEAMGCLTGTVASGSVTFQATTNTFTNLLMGGYCALTASSNTVAVTFAEGSLTVLKAPEIR